MNGLYATVAGCARAARGVGMVGVMAVGFASAGVASPLWAQGRAQPPATAITHVTVIDVATGKQLSDQTVTVRGNNIAYAGPSSKYIPAAGTRIIDGRGKFLIPGLWDMHVHLFVNASPGGTDKHDIYFPLLLANGVTGVRDMWTDLEDLKTLGEWQHDAAAGRLLMPNVIPTSTPVEGEAALWPTATKITTADAARRFVDSLHAGGARTLKMLEPSRDVYFAAVAEAQKLGMTVVGHVPPEVHASDASNAGQRSMEHLMGTLEGCSHGEAELTRMVASGVPQPAKRQQIMLDTYSDSLCDALFATFVKNGTWQVPTLTPRLDRLLSFDASRLDRPAMRYVEPRERSAWQTMQKTAFGSMDSSVVAARRRFADHVHAVTGRMQHAGVRIMAGSDVGNPYVIAGFGLHTELSELVASGLTPLEALRTATINPVDFLGIADSIGAVAKGKRADLVLLGADPLVEIHNLSLIRAVVVNGRVLDRAALDSLLKVAERAAAGRN